jgi:superfamily II DNA or RNA helicase
MINNYTGQVSKAEAIQTDWFTKRGLRVLNYQTEVLIKVKQSLQSQEVTVLAACPSAGKTIMVINTIEDYLAQNPSHKILVLAHGTTILRTQFHDNLMLLYSEIKSDFNYNLVENFNQYDSTANINVCLPQTLNGKALDSIDLLVVDEAHQFYFAQMVRDIINVTQPDKQLLITGTPSPFIRRGYPILPVTLNTIFDEGMISDVYIEIATSSYNFGIGDYNQQDELKKSIQFRDLETKKTLDDLIGKIVERLKIIRCDESTLIPEWLPTLEKLHKTMFVCKTQLQALQVQRYFDKIGVKSALSTSDYDAGSVEIERFKKEDYCLVLIVVGRGILGFNFPELVNVVDMTTSQNVDRIYQLLCRVIRKHPKGERKLFFKIAPSTLSEYYKYIMTGVLALNDESFFTAYTGRNFDILKIPVRKNFNGRSNSLKKNMKRPKFRPIKFEGLPAFELFKNLSVNNYSLLNPYAKATIRDIRAEFMKRNPFRYWTKENCVESAMNYNSISEWVSNESSAYQTAHRNGWLKECTIHMTTNVYWTKEKCFESALKQQRIVEWQRAAGGAYGAAKRNGWLTECTKHMVKKSPWTIEKCIASALKYKSRGEWGKNASSAYNFARKRGWLDECTSHMIKPIWTKECCIENARKYQSKSEWQKNEKSAYAAARKNNWLKACTNHMGDELKWTKDKCLESASKYNTFRVWYYAERGAYCSAKRNGWLEECRKHMHKIRKPNGYWTKERCIESAKKYQNKGSWEKGEKGAYTRAQKNGWFDECIQHFSNHKLVA